MNDIYKKLLKLTLLMVASWTLLSFVGVGSAHAQGSGPLAIGVSAPYSITAGENLTLTLEITNTSDTRITDTVVRSLLPVNESAGIEWFHSWTPTYPKPETFCSIYNAELSCYADLEPGESKTYSVSAGTDINAVPVCGLQIPIHYVASALALYGRSVPVEAHATTRIGCFPQPKLQAGIEAPKQITPGEDITATIAVSNVGNQFVYDVGLTVTLPNDPQLGTNWRIVWDFQQYGCSFFNDANQQKLRCTFWSTDHLGGSPGPITAAALDAIRIPQYVVIATHTNKLAPGQCTQSNLQIAATAKGDSGEAASAQHTIKVNCPTSSQEEEEPTQEQTQLLFLPVIAR